MKKLNRFLSLVFILSLAGCDFFQKDLFRTIAGRPTEAQLADFKDSVLTRRQEVADSISAVRELERKAEAARKDSLNGLWRLIDQGIQISSISAFGTPVEAPPYIYNAVVGVFRMEKTAVERMVLVSAQGFHPYYIYLKDGVKAVCVTGSNSLSALADSVALGMNAGVCPGGTWVFEYR